MTTLIAYLHKIYPLSAGCLDYLSLAIQTRSLQKSDFLLKAGQVCQHRYFVQTGLLRRFYYKGRADISAGFTFENELMDATQSFYQQSPSSEFIQCLEDTTIEYISFRDVEFICERFPEFIIIERYLHRQYLAFSDRYTAVLRLPYAAQKYEHISLHFPKVRQRVPGKYLASFLGISETNLSRIRNRR